MGDVASRPRAQSSVAPVTLNIYDVGRSSQMQMLNDVFRPLGTGVFHCAVEIYGTEWSYGAALAGTGVFSAKPRRCEHHSFRESVPMGVCKMSEDQVKELLKILKQDWKATAYDIIHRNCCHFSDEFCRWLGLGSIPAWVMNLAGNAAAISDPVTYARARGDSLMDKLAKGLGAACSGDPFSSLERERSSIVALGKQARGAAADDFTRFGDFSRGLVRRFSGDDTDDGPTERGIRAPKLVNYEM
eukprot:TRINITY_DN31866_c0_g1_i1.p1 TRINITY_DN31866_c0_g1~~TRINITY_DN31866_c0_g1_i1.p1  ORF type:complete len:254 (+),score=43.13 TRINITY_DN31866_c0_g1_i1:33-764(+)